MPQGLQSLKNSIPSYLFSIHNSIEAKEYFDINGFCGFMDLLEPSYIAKVEFAVNEAIASGKLTIGEDDLVSNNDAIYCHTEIYELCKNRLLIDIAKKLIGCSIELQHSKFNAKPQKNGEGIIPWHQDYPFYPHTNYDLISCVIHLDEETELSGPLEFIKGSHKLGVLRHTDSDGNFAYECTEPLAILNGEAIKMIVPKGAITFHHGLAVHRSGPKFTRDNRRLIVFQYRAIDAVQLAGVIWKCNGERVDETLPALMPSIARFPDGQTIELRGIGGRLYDPTQRLAPNKKLKAY